jgi:hypothetical protein
VARTPSESFEATFNSGISGLVGTVTFKIDDNEGNTVFGPTTAGIAEIGVTGIYSIVVTAPADEGDYSMVWSEDGSYDEQHSSNEDLTVQTAILGLSALPPLDSDPGAIGPPCSAWTSREAVSACCEGFSDDLTENQDAAIRAATEILFAASNDLYPGECGPVTVRPCNQGCGCWGMWALGMDYSWDPIRARWLCEGKVCGCSPVSEVVLSGVPIRSIEEVLIDGVALDPSEYALMEPNILVRMRDLDNQNRRLVWPGCQIMDLPETEEGTFAVTYTYGADPPQAGRSAAAALACEIWRACPTGTGECSLPGNVTTVVRQGVTIETAGMIAEMLKLGRTGIVAIDAFIGLFGGQSNGGRSSVWSPDLDYPRRYRPVTGT